jgi:GWxTD domain-containing protein
MRSIILRRGAVVFFLYVAFFQTVVFAIDFPANSHQTSVLSATQSCDETNGHWPRVTEATTVSPFLVDHACFQAKGNFTFVEFYVQVSYARLQFIRQGEAYQSIYEIDLYVEDREENLVLSQSARDTAKAKDYSETSAAEYYRLTLLNSYLRPGQYLVRIVLTDRETGKSFEVARELFVRDFSGQNLIISDLQFSRNIKVDSSASPFVKHYRRIEPNVAHLYGQFDAALFIYYEIYNLALPIKNPETLMTPSDSFRVQYLMHDARGNEVKRLAKAHRKPGTSSVLSMLLPIATLSSGQYKLTVQVFDEVHGAVAEISDWFKIHWHIFSFKDYQFEEILQQMRHVASREELQKLAQLPEAERQQGLLAFWVSRDPTPGTPQNEAMDEYYQRVRYANLRFKWFGKEGWESPQGEIYIKYGPPDKIHRYRNADLSEGARRPEWQSNGQQSAFPQLAASSSYQIGDILYEVWEYYHPKREFIFADRRGTGAYELIDPLSLNRSLVR